ncbi:MAG: Diacylglycerol kinase, partial [Candidatus Azambacteria bacterium GW2011_GWD2_46_48]
LILILTVISVLTLEMINTSIERILDLLHPEKHPEIKIIKDISAAAVLLAALGALVIGLKIFIPYVF